MRRLLSCVLTLVAAAGGAACVVGCNGPSQRPRVQVPRPINLLLPREIRILWLSKPKRLSDGNGARVLELHVEALDSFGELSDGTRAFGTFRFELYDHRANNANPKGAQLAKWDLPLLEPKTNALHWDSFTRMYKFRLKWDKSIPRRNAFVVVAVFTSPFTPRLIAERASVRP